MENHKIHWVNIEHIKFEKNFNRYIMIKLSEQSQFNNKEFIYWNDEWNINLNK